MRKYFGVQIKTALLVVWGFLTTIAGAEPGHHSVHFDDANRGPGDTLLVDGIHGYIPPWLSPPQPAGQLVTASGLGLGDNAAGPASSVDVQMHYAADAYFPDQ